MPAVPAVLGPGSARPPDPVPGHDAAKPADPRDAANSLDAIVHAGLVAELVAAQELIAHLRTALDTSRDIGTATGILMAQHRLDRQDAFDRLRSASQHSHRKLRDIALDVVTTGELPLSPGIPPSPAPVPQPPSHPPAA